MRKLSKIFLIVVFAVINLQSFGQVIGIVGGVNMANCKIKDIDGQLYTNSIFRPKYGVTFETELKDRYSIGTGLIIDYKGLRLDRLGTDDSLTILVYLDIPVNVRYRFDLGNNKLYLSAGPYIGIGIAGLLREGDEGEKVKWGNNKETDDFRRLDYGINVGAEYEFGRFGIGLQGQLGLANILSGGNSDNSQRNRLASIYFAYKFGK